MSVLSSIGVSLLGIASYLVLIVVTSVVTRRVLGVPTGWVRTVGVGCAVLTLTGPLVLYVLDRLGVRDPAALADDPVTTLVIGVGAVAATFGVALVALVVSELVVPSRRDVVGFRSVTAVGAAGRRLVRSTRVSLIFVRHGAGRMVLTAVRAADATERRRTARSLRRALEDCGPTFVKFGQMLSTRPELLPPEFVAELSTLHADVAPEPYERIERVAVAAWGRTPEEVFVRFDRTPLAAASVGQVHAATLPDGTEIVVKFRRPGARRRVEDDLAVLSRLSSRLARSSRWAREIGIDSLVHGFAASLREELDYTIEAENTRVVAANLPAGSAVRVPRVVDAVTTPSTLALGRMPGVPVSSAQRVLAGWDPSRRSEIASALLEVVLRQILESGVFHADLHPGNVLVDVADSSGGGRLSLLDFGAVGRLDTTSRTAIGRLLDAVRSGDSGAATDALYALLGRPDGVDDREIERELGALVLRAPRSGGGAAAFYAELTTFVLRRGFGVPPQVAAVFRTLSSLEGTLVLLDPGVALVPAAEAVGERLVRERMRPESLVDEVTSRVIPLLPTLEQLPRRLDRMLGQVEDGRLTVAVRPFGSPGDRAFVRSLVDRVVLTVLAATTLGAAVALFVGGPGPMLTERIAAFPVLGGAFLFIGLILSLRVLAGVFAPDST